MADAPRLLRARPAPAARRPRPAQYVTLVQLGSDSSRAWRYWLGAGQSATVDSTDNSRSPSPGTAAHLGRLFNLELRLTYAANRLDFQSPLHLVWSYKGLSSDVTDRPILDEQRSLFRVPATNTFLVKLSYWFSS